MTALWHLVQRRPARIGGLVTALLALVTAFGLHLTAAQTGGITAVVAALLGLFTESLVTPVVNLPAQVVPPSPPAVP